MRSSIRRSAGLSGALLLAVTGGTLAAGPARAAGAPEPRVISCSGTIAETFSPGLTVRKRPTRVTAHSKLTCTGGAVASVAFSSSYVVEASCLSNQLISVGSPQFRWDTGGGSTATFTYVVGRPAGQTVSAGVGEVMTGRFAGYAATRVLASPAPDAYKCLGSGIPSAKGVDHVTLVAQP
ncbi:hypothetical protein [Streptomyces noursei]|uniref:hypothetical protein n=1 Tax=Streptomyces noursei TaxID=1971 RepID=UPI0005C7E975|nr:hypothetical protein [Streptomyces noursei]